MAAVHIGQVYTSLLPYDEFNGYSCSSWFPVAQLYEEDNVMLLLQRFKNGHARIDHCTELHDPESLLNLALLHTEDLGLSL